MEWLFALIKKLVDNKFSGYMQINFVRGTLSNVNCHTTVRPEEESAVIMTKQILDDWVTKCRFKRLISLDRLFVFCEVQDDVCGSTIQ